MVPGKPVALTCLLTSPGDRFVLIPQSLMISTYHTPRGSPAPLSQLPTIGGGGTDSHLGFEIPTLISVYSVLSWLDPRIEADNGDLDPLPTL